MKEMGLFGLMIPEEYGGLGESLLTYALVVEQIARGWMSVSGVINTHFIVAYMLRQHGTDGAEGALPAEDGDRRDHAASFSMSEPDLGSDVAAIKTSAKVDGDDYVLNGAEDVADQRRLVEPHRGAGQDRRGRRDALPEHDDASWSRRSRGFGKVARGSRSPARSTRWATRASTPPRWCSTATASRRARCSAATPARPGLLPDDGRRRGRPRQRRGARLRHRDPRLRARHRVRPAALDVRQADRPAPGDRVQARRDGHQGRGRAPR